jgi:hypothetical protein
MSLILLTLAAAAAQPSDSRADAQHRLRSAIESSVVEGQHFATSSDGACATTYAWLSAGQNPAELLRTEGITIHWDQVLSAEVGPASPTRGFQHWIKAQTSNGYWDVHVSPDQVAKALEAARDLVRLCNHSAIARPAPAPAPAATVATPAPRPAAQPAPAAAAAVRIDRNYLVGRWTVGAQSCQKSWIEFGAGGRFTTGGGYAGTWILEQGRLVAIDEEVLDYVVNSDVRAIDRQSMAVGGSTFRRCG